MNLFVLCFLRRFFCIFFSNFQTCLPNKNPKKQKKKHTHTQKRKSWGSWFEQTWVCTTSECFNTQVKKLFCPNCFFFNSLFIWMLKFAPPPSNVVYPTVGYNYLKKPWIWTTWEYFQTSFIFSGPMAFEKKVFNDFSLFNRMLKCWPLPSPSHLILWHDRTPGDSDFNKCEFTLHDDAFTQVSYFVSKKFLRRLFNLFFYLFIYS